MNQKDRSVTYKAKFYITVPCAEKYREFCDLETRSLPPHDIARHLDERINDAVHNGRMSQIEDAAQPNELTNIALVESRAGMRCYVVLRNMRPSNNVAIGPSGGGLATIGVLPESVGYRNLTNGSWKMVNRPFAEKLAGMKIVPPAPRLEVVKEPTPPTPTPTPTPPPDIKPDGKAHRANRSSNVKKFPPGARSREARAIRIRWARNELMQRPFMSANGPDGLLTMMDKRFGIGLDPSIINELRAECQRARGFEPEPTKQGGYRRGDMTFQPPDEERTTVSPVPDPPEPSSARSPARAADAIMKIAQRLSEANNAKHEARAAREVADKALADALAAVEIARGDEREANDRAAQILAEMVEAQS